MIDENQDQVNDYPPASAEVLDENLDGVDVSSPVLTDGVYKMTVQSVEEVENKKTPGTHLVIQLALAEDVAKTVQGREVFKGFPITHRIGLTAKENYDPRPSLAQFKLAATGSKLGAFRTLDQYVGKIVLVRITVQDDKQYGLGNKVSRFVVPRAAPAE